MEMLKGYGGGSLQFGSDLVHVTVCVDLKIKIVENVYIIKNLKTPK